MRLILHAVFAKVVPDGAHQGDEPFAREDFDIATTDGSLLRVYFDRLERRWFADGVYD